MNVVIINMKTLDSPRPDENQAAQNSYTSLRSLLSRVGKVLALDERGNSQGFLLTTHDILAVLAKAPPLNPSVSIQIFSLTSPEAQLIGTVTQENQVDPESYFLKLPDQSK